MNAFIGQPTQGSSVEVLRHQLAKFLLGTRATENLVSSDPRNGQSQHTATWLTDNGTLGHSHCVVDYGNSSSALLVHMLDTTPEAASRVNTYVLESVPAADHDDHLDVHPSACPACSEPDFFGPFTLAQTTSHVLHSKFVQLSRVQTSKQWFDARTLCITGALLQFLGWGLLLSLLPPRPPVAYRLATGSAPLIDALQELEAEYGLDGVPDAAIGAKCAPILDHWFFAKTPHVLAMTLGHDVERRMQPFIAATVPGVKGVFKVGCLGTCPDRMVLACPG